MNGFDPHGFSASPHNGGGGIVEKLPPFIGPGASEVGLPPKGVTVGVPAPVVSLAVNVRVGPPAVTVGRRVLVGVGVRVAVGVLGGEVWVSVGPPEVAVGGSVGVALGTSGIGGIWPPLFPQIAVTLKYIGLTGWGLLRLIVIVLAG
jgi:hypothetical protein